MGSDNIQVTLACNVISHLMFSFQPVLNLRLTSGRTCVFFSNRGPDEQVAVHEEEPFDLTMTSVLAILQQLCRIQLNKHFKLCHSF